MNKVKIICLKAHLESVLQRLQNLNLIQIVEEKGIHTQNTNEISDLDENISKTKRAKEILSSDFCPPKELDDFDIKKAVLKIHSANDQIETLKDENKKCEDAILTLLKYKNLDMPISYNDSTLFDFKTGYITGAHTIKQLNNISQYIYFEVLLSEKDKTYVWLVCRKNHLKELEKIQFTELDIKTPLSPPEHIKHLEGKIRQNNILIDTHKKTIDNYRGLEDKFSLLPMLRKKERLEESQKVATTESTATIYGYIPAKFKKTLKKEFDECVIDFYPADENAPVLFENGFFASPVEDITATYSMPSKTDVDPNPIMAFFYYLFFGMMFSDAGYGAIMVLVCGYMGYVNKSKNYKMMQMFFFCGISTLFWGLMYGSFFGNLFASVAETFFGRKIVLRPLWIDPTGEPLTLLIFSIALGFIQIITGLCIKLYSELRLGNIKDGLLDTSPWIITLSGLGLTAAGISFPQLQKAGILVLIAGVILLILTQGRKQKNPVMKLFSGILSLYNITSYISDILSYSRLMALGLATGVIAQVVNILGSLGGKSVIGVMMYILVFIIGHSMNFAINMLGAYVHTNRLQYVEFYSKFYEGGGKRFVPFGRKYFQEIERN